MLAQVLGKAAMKQLLITHTRVLLRAVGILAAHCAKVRGAAKVVLIDKVPYRLDHAKKHIPGTLWCCVLIWAHASTNPTDSKWQLPVIDSTLLL
jgi:hypothetical protein